MMYEKFDYTVGQSLFTNETSPIQDSLTTVSSVKP